MLVRNLAAAFLVGLVSWPVSAETVPDAALGRRLYREGIRADGSAVQAKAEDDVRLAGPRLGCVGCHRPSGFGVGEGGFFVPPITGPTLFQPRQLDRARFFQNRFEQAQPKRYQARLHQPHMRPAYSEESLGRVLRTGVDPAGEALDPVMPRYVLSDADIANLSAYLRTLSAEPDEGVTPQEIHFATIIGPDVSSSERAAMLATIETYFDWVNKHSAGDRSRGGFSPFYRSEFVDSYRAWRLRVWELKGAPESWPEQLERYYAAQPVFAMIGGLARGPWRVIADFCDAHRLPALFPATDLPETGEGEAGYTFYFSEGLELEAKGLAAFLAGASPRPVSVREVVGPGVGGVEPARVFERELAARLPGVTLTIAPLSAPLKGGSGTDTIVIWPGEADDDTIAALVGTASPAARVLLPSSRIDMAKTKLPKDVAARLLLADPYELPTVEHPLSYRVRAWMRSRGLDINEPRLQFQTYYALSLLEAALGRLIKDFYRDYLIESVEHEAEGDLNPGIFPALALGPGQRFAAKGIHVVRPDPSARDGITAVSDWIVP